MNKTQNQSKIIKKSKIVKGANKENRSAIKIKRVKSKSRSRSKSESKQKRQKSLKCLKQVKKHKQLNSD